MAPSRKHKRRADFKPVRIGRDEAQAKFRELRAKDEKPPEQPDLVSHDYKLRVKDAMERALRARSMTRGITLAIEREGDVVCIVSRQYGKQNVHCQAAYESGHDPEQIGRAAAAAFEESANRVRAGLPPTAPDEGQHG